MVATEKMVETLKIFFEKHLIPTVLCLVMATVVFLATPSDYWIILRITDSGFFAFLAGVFFLFEKLVVIVYKTTVKIRSNKKLDKEIEEKEEHDAMERLWVFIDELSQTDREILFKFIKSKNEPISMACGWYDFSSVLNNPKCVHSRTITRDGLPVRQYVLEESFFKSLTYSYERYGKICHFENDF